MNAAGIAGTLTGTIISLLVALLPLTVYARIRMQRTVWNDFILMVFGTSFLIFLLSLNGFLRVYFGFANLWIVDLALYALLVANVYRFIKKGLGMLASVLGVEV